MIVVIEGPSAVGKTTWCRTHCLTRFVEEAAPDLRAPDLYSSPHGVAEFWVDFAVKRWQAAERMEDENGLAVCDGSPLHLYYSWALWKSGALGADLFEIETRLYRRAIERRWLGFADLVVWLDAPMAELRRRAAADSTRRRRRHEMNLACVPWMKAWFRERERLLPGSLRPWSEISEMREFSVRIPAKTRYDPTILDRIIAALPNTPALTTECDIAQTG